MAAPLRTNNSQCETACVQDTMRLRIDQLISIWASVAHDQDHASRIAVATLPANESCIAGKEHCNAMFPLLPRRTKKNN
jgi:hypothetical protein